MPRIFNTEGLGKATVSGNRHIRSPHHSCPRAPKSSAWGIGGRHGQPGHNCDPKGNGLIIQKLKATIPDASEGDGTITFDFDPPVAEVRSIGFLNIDSNTDFLRVSALSEKFMVPILGLGFNAAQDVEVDAKNVRSVEVHMHGPRAITHFTFCTHANVDGPR
jgi:hypothetical protein